MHARAASRCDAAVWCGVLRRMEGGELFDRLIKHGAYSEYDAREAFRQVARGLAYIHR